jgi:hypothetical protein
MTTAFLVVDLVLLAGLTLWLLEGVGRTAVHYVRTGVVVRGSGQRMLVRGMLAVATCAIWTVLR